MSSADRQFDVVVFGATGFTGALVADYMLSQYGSEETLRWALAARDEEKLRALKASMGPGAAALETIVADSFDEVGLRAMASRTRVVLTTVGPYAKYGSALVAACAASGTHYCDLAGETQWIRRMIDTHHGEARRTGARIVHCCGFDSVPMDMGVWFLQQETKRRHGDCCESIVMLVRAMKGGASGGTLASMMNIIKESRADREVARVLADPYGLNPEGERNGPDGADQREARYDKVADAWTGPFVMAGINTRVVRRTNALLDYPYGRDFKYREAVMTGRGAAGRFKAVALTATLGAFVAGASIGATRAVLERFLLTQPGDGPDENARASGFFDLRLFGTRADSSVVHGKVTGDRDPGYGSTSKMLSECAVCLAKDDLASGGGVLTPAAAMGEALLTRLRKNAGLSFELLD